MPAAFDLHEDVGRKQRRRALDAMLFDFDARHVGHKAGALKMLDGGSLALHFGLHDIYFPEAAEKPDWAGSRSAATVICAGCSSMGQAPICCDRKRPGPTRG